MSEKRLSALVVLSVGKNLLESSSNFNEKVIEAFVLCKDRRMDLTYKYTVGKGFLQFKFALLCLYSYVLQNYCQFFLHTQHYQFPYSRAAAVFRFLCRCWFWAFLFCDGATLLFKVGHSFTLLGISLHTHTPTVSYNTLL
jgi:hypothetical protein